MPSTRRSTRSLTTIIVPKTEVTSQAAKAHNGKENTREPVCPSKKKIKLESEENVDISTESDSQNVVIDFEERRLKNIQLNAEFLAKIGVNEAKVTLTKTVPPKTSATKRGLKTVREPTEILPRRSSLRLQNKTPDGLELPPEYLINKAAYQPYEPEEHLRPSAGQLVMKDRLFKSSSEDAHISLMKTCHGLKEKPSLSRTVSFDSAVKDFQQIKITEKRVAKVVPNRTFSVTIHPSESQVLVATGGKWGKLGLWNVLDGEGSGSDGVCCYEPHSRPVVCLEFPTHQPEKIFSCSYDGSLRCGDLNKEIFDDVYSVPEEDNILLRNFNFLSPHSLAVSRQDGYVAVVDTRTTGNNGENVYKLQDTSLRTLSVHPTMSHYITTAARDGSVSIWDMRKLHKYKNRPLAAYKHGKGVNSAYFSPITGKYILTTSMDDRLTILDSSNLSCELKVKKSFSHNNHTGRWLTVLRACWHPAREDIFVSGSMRRPREIELYNGEGKILHRLQDDEWLNSVCSLNAIHPSRPIVVGANSSGRLHVFM